MPTQVRILDLPPRSEDFPGAENNVQRRDRPQQYRETNVKLRAIAEQVLTDICTLGRDDSAPYREKFDRLLLTVHERVPKQ
jgi:hypothetical protein